MGFLDKAKEAAQQASVKAKEAAEVAQKKLEEAQEQFNERQAQRAQGRLDAVVETCRRTLEITARPGRAAAPAAGAAYVNLGEDAYQRDELDTALRLNPRDYTALREMGLVLFASRQYDLARRFFVRAVTVNPQDRASQGYLGCALTRLGRVPEGTKFINNAGAGPWTNCLQPVTPQAAPPPL